MNAIIEIVKMLALWEFIKAYHLAKACYAELVSASIMPNKWMVAVYKWTLERSHRKVKQVQGDELLGVKI